MCSYKALIENREQMMLPPCGMRKHECPKVAIRSNIGCQTLGCASTGFHSRSCPTRKQLAVLFILLWFDAALSILDEALVFDVSGCLHARAIRR